MKSKNATYLLSKKNNTDAEDSLESESESYYAYQKIFEINKYFSLSDLKKMEIENIIEEPLDSFEKASNQTISNLLDKSSKAEAKLTELISQLSNHINGSENSDGIPTEKDEAVFRKMVDCNSELYMSNEYLKALSDMKIVYLFKSVEIRIKSLIRTAYPKTDTKKFYKWGCVCCYFDNINIKISDFDGYAELEELRKINNNIKHNEMIEKNANKIKEFANESQFTYLNFENFYNRVKPKIQNFIESLGKAIIEQI